MNPGLIDKSHEEEFQSPFFDLKYSVKNQCDNCKNNGILICTNCKVGCYCSTECQKEGWKTHKTSCKKLKQLWNLSTEEEKKLKADGFMNNFCLMGKSGNWYYHTCTLADSLKSYETTQGIKESTKLLLKLLYYSQNDHSKTRYAIVHNLIALGMDQEAYDFVKFYLIKGYYLFQAAPSSKYKNYLNYWNCDRSEPIVNLSGYPLSVEMYSALLLIKHRLFYSCLQRELFCHFLLGTHSRCGEDSVVSKVSGNYLILHKIYDYVIGEKQLTKLSSSSSVVLGEQIKKLFEEAVKGEGSFWKAILEANPQEILKSPLPEMIMVGGCDDYLLKLKNVILGWKASPDAFNWLQDILPAVEKSSTGKRKHDQVSSWKSYGISEALGYTMATAVSGLNRI
jgi:hypothetical protein